jgi:hypothetical protein
MYVYIKTLENKYIFDVNPQHTISYLKYQIQDILEIKINKEEDDEQNERINKLINYKTNK